MTFVFHTIRGSRDVAKLHMVNLCHCMSASDALQLHRQVDKPCIMSAGMHDSPALRASPTSSSIFIRQRTGDQSLFWYEQFIFLLFHVNYLSMQCLENQTDEQRQNYSELRGAGPSSLP